MDEEFDVYTWIIIIVLTLLLFFIAYKALSGYFTNALG